MDNSKQNGFLLSIMYPMALEEEEGGNWKKKKREGEKLAGGWGERVEGEKERERKKEKRGKKKKEEGKKKEERGKICLESRWPEYSFKQGEWNKISPWEQKA